MESENVTSYAIDFYNDIGCYDEASRVSSNGVCNADYDKVGFDMDSCMTDIDIILEDKEYVYKRENGEIVNSSSIYLFGEE